MINWAFFPRNERAPQICRSVIECFEQVAPEIDSHANNGLIGEDFKDAASNFVLAKVRPRLVQLGFRVEDGKAAVDRIPIPVLFGPNGRPAKSFEADAYHELHRLVLEVEAGRAVTNYQFLKDLFQASVMVDVDYLCIAVRNIYRRSADFEKVYTFMDTLFTSTRLRLPLKGVLIIGY